MTDRFAASLDECGKRHKGVRVGTVWARDASGDVTLSTDFLNWPTLERLDILKDTIGVLTREYNNTLQAWHNMIDADG